MGEFRGEGWPVMAGYSAHTNGPGSIDDRRYPQNATFMTHLSPASCQFTLGSAVLRKNTKKTQPVYFGDMPNTGGTLLHKRPLIDAGMLETDRRAEYDRRAAYDNRVELTRRAEYDRRLEYDRRNKIAMCPIRDDEEWTAQLNRLIQMGKIIETLTTMFMKPQVKKTHEETTEGEGFGSLRANHEQLTVRKIFKINRKLLHPRQQVEAEVCGFARAHETELSERKILKLRRKTEEEEKIESAAKSAAAEAAAKEAETKEDMRAKKERRRDCVSR